MAIESKVAAIVVTYNRLDLLKKCLTALENQNYHHINHLIVINNHSTDGTAKYLATLTYKGLIVKNLHENLGGAGGFNKGLKVAISETDDDSFWMMDDDTFVHDDTLHAFQTARVQLGGRYSFLSANVKDPNGISANVPVPSPNWPTDSNKGLIRIDNASFVSIFINRQAVQKFGLPISDFFIWHDDTEYTIRLNQFAPGYFVTNAFVTHNAKVGKTQITAVNDETNRIFRYYYLFRNEVYIMRKYFNKKRVIKAVLHGYIVALRCLLSGKGNRVKRFVTVLKGTTAGLYFHPRVERVK